MAHLLEKVLGKVAKVVRLGDAAKTKRVRSFDVGFEAVARLEELEEVEESEVVVLLRRALQKVVSSGRKAPRTRKTDGGESKGGFHSNSEKVVVDEDGLGEVGRDDR